MANVIFYSTGEIFWVTDPPESKPHIGVPHIFPNVPPDHLFTYSLAAHHLNKNGHKVVGAYGRQRLEMREGKKEDPKILELKNIEDVSNTVLVIIATDSGTRAQGGVDHFPRIPFTENERNAIHSFNKTGGGLYITSDHGPLGYESLKELDLHHPIEPEPEEPLRPNVEWSNDSTDSAKVRVVGQKKLKDGTYIEYKDVWLSTGPPAGYLQKIVPAQVLYKNRQAPHPIFNGVGDKDGIWIPAHMHECKFKIKASLRGIDETAVADQKIKTMAVHIPFTETTFSSFAVMCYKESSENSGRIMWGSSFHHLVDINWVSDGKVSWDNYVPFSAEALWKQQFPPEIFDSRMDKGMKRLWVNIIDWLPSNIRSDESVVNHMLMEKSDQPLEKDDYTPEDNYPDPSELFH